VFSEGFGGDDLAWVGRLTPEKGADIAVRAAAQTGRHLRLAGPLSDPEWFDGVLRPLLGGTAEYVGTLAGQELSDLYARSVVTLVTPQWDEPFCLVAAESQMCGTPVAGLARGGLPEVVQQSGGQLVAERASPVERLAQAVEVAARMDRREVAADARRRLTTDHMLDRYEDTLTKLTAEQQG
jgi:glycosyltransferase involved in cell wall biosynthesis